MLLSADKLTVPIPGRTSSIKRANSNLVSQASFELERGKIMAVIGPNGAGKSSLIKAIQGELAYQGSINMPSISLDPKVRATQLAVMPQQSPLNFPFRVSEVVELGRIPHSTGKQKDHAIVAQALELMDISSLADRNYTRLSGGEKQRVQLARVFSQIWEPTQDATDRLLLLDEPSSSLDLGHQHHLMRAVKSFAERGVSVIMVMHDINLAARYADQLLALLCSEQIAIGSPQDVVTQANMERLYGVSVEVLTSKLHNTPVLIGA